MRVAGETGARGLVPTTDRYGTALGDLVRCLDCGHAQVRDMPSVVDLAEAYGEAEDLAYLEEEIGQRITADRLLDEIERQTARGKIADLGCWVGFLLSEATARGWRGVGVEPSLFAATYARDTLGLDVVNANLLDTDLDSDFDAVVMADVIEHLPDPGAALDHVADLFTSRGVLALTLPDAGSRMARLLGHRWWSVIPTHVQYFTRHSLGVLLNRHGYEVIRITTAPKVFTVSYYLERASGYRPGAARVLVGAADRLGIGTRLWAPDFRDRMLVIAMHQRPQGESR